MSRCESHGYSKFACTRPRMYKFGAGSREGPFSKTAKRLVSPRIVPMYKISVGWRQDGRVPICKGWQNLPFEKVVLHRWGNLRFLKRRKSHPRQHRPKLILLRLRNLMMMLMCHWSMSEWTHERLRSSSLDRSYELVSTVWPLIDAWPFCQPCSSTIQVVMRRKAPKAMVVRCSMSFRKGSTTSVTTSTSNAQQLDPCRTWSIG